MGENIILIFDTRRIQNLNVRYTAWRSRKENWCWRLVSPNHNRIKNAHSALELTRFVPTRRAYSTPERSYGEICDRNITRIGGYQRMWNEPSVGCLNILLVIWLERQRKSKRTRTRLERNTGKHTRVPCISELLKQMATYITYIFI